MVNLTLSVGVSHKFGKPLSLTWPLVALWLMQIWKPQGWSVYDPQDLPLFMSWPRVSTPVMSFVAKPGVPASTSLHALRTACDRYAELNAAVASRVSTKLALWSVPLFRCSFLPCLGCFQKRNTMMGSKRYRVPAYWGPSE